MTQREKDRKTAEGCLEWTVIGDYHIVDESSTIDRIASAIASARREGIDRAMECALTIAKTHRGKDTEAGRALLALAEVFRGYEQERGAATPEAREEGEGR